MKWLLPNGRYTTNVDEYTDEWYKVGVTLEDFLKMKVYTITPDLTFYSNDRPILRIPHWLAVELIKLLIKAEEGLK